MNKAFVKEPEAGNEYCPSCKSLGQPVGRATLDALIRPSARSQLGEAAYFCPFPSCEVAYFDAFDRSVEVNDLAHSIYPKHPDAAICPCFGLTVEDIEADVAEGVVTRVKAHRAQTNSQPRQCSVLAGNGQCCVSDVQRHFMRLRGS